MDILWEKFQGILPLYIKPISFQSKASVVCSVTIAVFIDLCLKKLNVFSQHIGPKNKWISEFHRTNPQELKCWSTFYVNYFLRYYLMMQHQPVVKRVNGTHEWAHRPYQPLSVPYHCYLYKHRQLDERQPPADRCPFVLRHSISQVTSFMQLGMLWTDIHAGPWFAEKSQPSAWYSCA